LPPGKRANFTFQAGLIILVILKKRFFCFAVVLPLLVTSCDLFEISLPDYLRAIPPELRLDSLWAEHNSKIFYPLEAMEAGRDAFTIVVTPASIPGIGIALQAGVHASSSVTLPQPWTISSRPAVPVANMRTYQKYRDNEERQIVVTAANGMTKTYTVTIVWAKLIDDPGEIRSNLFHDYYLRPGPPIQLPPEWLPIGAIGFPGEFSGSLRGNGRTVRIQSFRPALYTKDQGLFGKIKDAWIEDIHIETSAPLSARAANVGLLAGSADGSVIRQVKVSGDISNTPTGAKVNVGGIAGILGDKSVVYDSASYVNVSGYAGSGVSYSGLYMGGVVGSLESDSGGNIINTYAAGNIIAGSAATVGGIVGGGGYSKNTSLKPESNVTGCVASNPIVDAGGGRADYVLGEWAGPTTGKTIDINSYNRHNGNAVLRNSPNTVPPEHRITGVSLPDDELKTKAAYTALGWDFDTVWKMAGGRPALIWE
jgi:hypothetical protein